MPKDYEKYTLKNGKTRYRKTVSLGTYADGRRRQKRITADTLKELRRKESETILGARRKVGRGDMTFSECVDAYFSEIESSQSPITVQNKRHVFYGIMACLNDKQLRRIGSDDIEEIIDNRSTEISYATLRKEMTDMKAFFTWCYVRRLTDENVMEKMKIPPYRHKERPFLTEKEMWNVIMSARRREHRMAFLVICFTGLRKEELGGLSIGDLWNHELHLSHVAKRIKGKGIVITESFKNETSKRIVPIPLWIEHDLREFLETADYPFREMSGRLSHIMRETVGSRNLTVHDLRHSYAALLISKGVDIYTLSKIMGHSSIDTTARIYGHLYDESRRKVASLL